MTRTVLLVDDDPAILDLIGSSLDRHAFTVHRASNAKAAYALIDAHTFDLAIVDGLLPDQPGTEIVARLRTLNPCPRIVFISTFYGDPESKRALTIGGVDRILHKPFSPSELLVVAESLVRQPPATPDDPVELRLADLRERYAERLDAKIDAIIDAYRRAQTEGERDTGLADALSLAHKLHGTAGAYGFAAVGDLCGRIEHAIKALDEDGDDDAVATAVAALEQRRRSTPAVRERPSAPAWQPLADVLVVDDDPDFLKQLRAMGREKLINVRTAMTPEQALTIVTDNDIDGAIVDVNLACDVNGYELARELRALEGRHDLPLVLLSSDDSAHTRVAAAHAGATLFLPKPVEADAFEDAVHHMATLRRTSDASVLIVDDDHDFARHARIVLEANRIRVHHIDDTAQFLEALASVEPDLLLLDLLMPGLTGFDLTKLVRSSPRYKELPIVLATAEASADIRIACFEAGADDYLPKPIVDRELIARVRTRIERTRLRNERGNRDALTRLLMRRPFAEALDSRIAEAKRSEVPIAVTLIDIDHFKHVNDKHGHLAGDRVLAALGGLLRRSFRKTDLRARWGGEEFVIALFGEPAEQAARIIERLLEEFRLLEFEGDAGTQFSCTFSAGVVAYPSDGHTLEALLRAADAKLYEAKDGGRNRVLT